MTTKRYIESVGRRKTAIARVRITEAAKRVVTVNDKEFGVYFPTKELQAIVLSPLEAGELVNTYAVSVKVLGGGIHAQAEAVRHGLSRSLVKSEASIKDALKKLDLLKRDPRAVERKKFGLKKARKAPTWSKR
ncbi:MAG: 30S ribosomal protein S9 [Minisyncoccia bacterium]